MNAEYGDKTGRYAFDNKGEEKSEPVAPKNRVPFHPLDGILFATHHPGTTNVDTTQNLAAWHERSAVHRALGDDRSETDVSNHIRTIQWLADKHPEMLGAAWKRYGNAAKHLPQLVKGSADPSTIYSSKVGSRPYGPRMDALTEMVRPLVGIANKMLAGTGKTQPLGQKFEPFAAHNPEETPEKLPEPKKAIDAPVAKVDNRKTIKAGKGKEAAEAKANEQPTIDNEQPPIPLVPGPNERGGRFATIHAMVRDGHPKESIVAALQKPPHGLTPKQAADTFRRWTRSESARRMIEAEERKPLRLARPGETTVGLDELGKSGAIGGTALEYHLKHLMKNGDAQVSFAAKKALEYDRNKPLREAHSVLGAAGYNQRDPYAYLGQLLKERGHKLANAYNWSSMKDSLERDRSVEKLFAGARAKFSGGDRAFWEKMTKQMRDPGKAAVWEQVLARMLGHTREQIEDSIHRIADRHLDREYLAAVKEDVAARTKANKAVKGSPLLPAAHSQAEEAGEMRDASAAPGSELHWRTVMGRDAQGPHRFARKYHEYTADEKGAHGAMVDAALKTGPLHVDYNAVAPMGDWLEEHEHPDARLVQEAARRTLSPGMMYPSGVPAGQRGPEMWEDPEHGVLRIPGSHERFNSGSKGATAFGTVVVPPDGDMTKAGIASRDQANTYWNNSTYAPFISPAGAIIRFAHRSLRDDAVTPDRVHRRGLPLAVPVKSRADLDYLTEHLHPEIRRNLHAFLDAHLPESHES